MTGSAKDTRAIGALAAGLTPTERARLVVRLARDGDARGLAAVRVNLPDAAAAAAHDRVVLLLVRVAECAMLALPGLVAGAERDRLALGAAVGVMLRRRRAAATLADLWAAVGYPVTAAERAALAAGPVPAGDGAPAGAVPALVALGGVAAGWDVRPDGEAAAVAARRAGLLAACQGILRGVGDPDGDGGLGDLSLEPPGPREERERASATSEAVWRHGRDAERDRLAEVARAHAARSAELAAVAAAVERLGDGVFGGEDPLPPPGRALLDEAAAAEEGFAGLWEVARELLPPGGDDDAGWPPGPGLATDAERVAAALEDHLYDGLPRPG